MIRFILIRKRTLYACLMFSFLNMIFLLPSCRKDMTYAHESESGAFHEIIPPRERMVNPVRTLETVNSFYGHWACGNESYLYGMDVRDLKVVLRKAETGQTVEKRESVASIDPAFEMEYKMFTTSTPGMLFIPVKKGSNYFLLKTADGGATFRNVFTFGEGNGPNGTNSSDVRLLRGILELTRDLPSGADKGTLFIPEYNVNKSRTAGSTNDRVRIMRSDDNGETWSRLVEWNTNGKNQIGHIHAMKQDPYTGYIYICVGDDNKKSGIIKWDGVSPWSDNKTMAEISLMPGFKVLTGAQRYRACDVLFDENSFYIFSDTQDPNNPGGTESGIWKGSKDFSSYIRVDNQVYGYDHMHVGWFGEKINGTFVFTTSREYTDATYHWNEVNLRVYTSNDGIHWYASGVLNWNIYGSPNRYLYNVFTFNDRFYIDCVSAAGHNSTIQCTLSKEWKVYEEPVILHPVYFAGNWNSPGNDANSGQNADSPKQTLAGILNNGTICAGARVRIAPGTYNEKELRPVWNNAPAQGKGSVVIEGQGTTVTNIIHMPGTAGDAINIAAANTLASADMPLIMKDLDISVSTIAGTDHGNYTIYNKDTFVKTINCRIGSVDNDMSTLVKLGAQGAGYCSENSVYIANSSASDTNRYIIDAANDNSVIKLKNCIILNGWNAFNIDRNGTNLELKNCTFFNTGNHAVVISADARIFIKNCIFSCFSAPIVNVAGGSGQIDADYNLYSKPNRNLFDGFYSLPAGTDPQFADPGSNNFHLQAQTPCRSSGIYLSDVTYDFTGRARNNPPSIGAFEK